MENAILISYSVSLIILFIFGMQGLVMVYYYHKTRHRILLPATPLERVPLVTIQLPLYNEMYVVRRLIDAVSDIDYPRDKFEIQVLDDSTDETVAIVAEIVKEKKALGIDITHVHRTNRQGFKAGALKEGLEVIKGEFVAIFDADFIPKRSFLRDTLLYFGSENVGMVQTRWEHLNGEYSMLTRAQAIALDGHFSIEQRVRNKAGFFINFNGTGGVWRKSCIFDAGNWEADTLTEDLDLSYRAQLRGWKFIYLNDVTSPAELPSEITALKSQQFRWTKGAIETSKKILPKVWASKLPLKVKLQSTIHLTNNIVFPFILLAGILNVPLIYIKNNGSNHSTYFALMSVFALAFVGSFLFYAYSQKDIHADWRKRIFLFPVFMAGSMGFAINNTRAVMEGLFNKKSEFTRTPKYGVVGKDETWKKEKKHYSTRKISLSIILELILSGYCFFGVGSALYFLELAAVPFQLMFALGFGLVGFLSLKHALGDSFLPAFAKKTV